MAKKKTEALAFGYFSIAYYAYKAIKLLKEN